VVELSFWLASHLANTTRSLSRRNHSVCSRGGGFRFGRGQPQQVARALRAYPPLDDEEGLLVVGEGGFCLTYTFDELGAGVVEDGVVAGRGHRKLLSPEVLILYKRAETELNWCVG
jgi:hypothetical protein